MSAERCASLEEFMGLLRAVVADPGGHGTGELAGSTRLVDELGLDSLDLVEVAVLVQELAGVPLHEFAHVPHTVADLYHEYLRLAAPPTAPRPSAG